MHYDLSATVHYKLTKGGNGHYMAISRSRDLQSQQWFMYDDHRVSSSNLSATVHYKLTKGGNGHYMASRSRDLQSQQWFMYDDHRVSSSNFTNRNTMVKKAI